MICHKTKTIFIHIPKCAGQSIEHIFLKINGLTWATRSSLLLRKNDNEKLGPPRLAHLLGIDYVNYNYITQDLFDNYYKFTVVRDPYLRVYSFYTYFDYPKKMSFENFVCNELEKQFVDNHWFFRPQCDYLKDSEGRVLVDDIYKLENLSEDINYLKAHLCTDFDIPHVNASKSVSQPGNILSRVFFSAYNILNINAKKKNILENRIFGRLRC